MSISIIVFILLSFFQLDVFAIGSGQVNINVNIALISPSNLSIQNLENGSVYAQWSADTNMYPLDYFKLYYKKSSDTVYNNVRTIYVNNGSIYTSTIITDLPNGYYDFLIQAFNDKNQGTDTICITRSCKVNNFLVSDIYPPNPVTNLIVTNTGTDNISLRWNKSISNDVVKQYLYVYTGSAFSEIDMYVILNKNIESIKVTNLLSGTKYNFAIVVEDLSGNKSTESKIFDFTSIEQVNIIREDQINTNAIFITNQNTSTTIIDNVISTDDRLKTVVANIVSNSINISQSGLVVLTGISDNIGSGSQVIIPAGTNITKVVVETLNTLSGAIYTWDGIVNSPKEIPKSQLIITGNLLSDNESALGVDYIVTELSAQNVDKVIEIGSNHTGVSIIFNQYLDVIMPSSNIYSGSYISIYYSNNNNIWKFLDNGQVSIGTVNGVDVQFSSPMNIANDGIPDLFKVYYDPTNVNVPYYTKFKTDHFTRIAGVIAPFSPIPDVNNYEINNNSIKFKWYFQSSKIDENNNIIHSSDYKESRFICDNCPNNQVYIIPKSQGNNILLTGLSSNTTYNGRVKFCNDVICSDYVNVSAKTSSISSVNIDNFNGGSGWQYSVKNNNKGNNIKNNNSINNSNINYFNNNQINNSQNNYEFSNNEGNNTNTNIDTDVNIDINNVNNNLSNISDINSNKDLNDAKDIQNDNIQNNESKFKLFNFDNNILVNNSFPILFGYYLPNAIIELIIFDGEGDLFSTVITKSDAKGLFTFIPNIKLPNGNYSFIFRSIDGNDKSITYNIKSIEKYIPNVIVFNIEENGSKPIVYGRSVNGYTLKGIWKSKNNFQYFTKFIDNINGDFVITPDQPLIDNENILYLYHVDADGYSSEFIQVDLKVNNRYALGNIIEDNNAIADNNSNNNTKQDVNNTSLNNNWFSANILSSFFNNNISSNILLDIFILFFVVLIIGIGVYRYKLIRDKINNIQPSISKKTSKLMLFKIHVKKAYNVITRIFS